MSEVITIRSEDEAFVVLKQMLDGELGGDAQVSFSDWPTIDLKYHGPQFDQTITTGVMRALLDLQKSLNQSYALMVYGSPNSSRLTHDERDQLELIVKVGPGSSELGAKLAEILNSIIPELANKLESKHITMILVSAALIWGGNSVAKSYIQTKADVRRAEIASQKDVSALDSITRLSKLETERLKIILEVVKEEPIIKEIQDVISLGQDAVIKSGSEAEKMEYQGVVLMGDAATQLSKAKRRQPAETILTNYFYVTTLNAEKSDVHKITLRPKSGGEPFPAMVIDEKTPALLQDTIKQAIWNRSAIKLNVQVHYVGDEVRRAYVIDSPGTNS